jgi:hypothetical protein
MSGEMICPKCGRQVVRLAPPEVVWVSCPHCGERVLNLAALNAGAPRPLSCLVAVVFALCAALAPGFVIALVGVLGGPLRLLGFAPPPIMNEVRVMVVLGSLGCLAYGLLLYTGVLLSRAARAPEGRGLRTVAGGSAFILCVMVLAVMLFLGRHLGG